MFFCYSEPPNNLCSHPSSFLAQGHFEARPSSARPSNGSLALSLFLSINVTTTCAIWDTLTASGTQDRSENSISPGASQFNALFHQHKRHHPRYRLVKADYDWRHGDMLPLSHALYGWLVQQGTHQSKGLSSPPRLSQQAGSSSAHTQNKSTIERDALKACR